MNIFATLPEGRAGKILASGLALLAVCLLWLGAAAPLISWYESRAQTLAQTDMEAAHLAMLAAALPSLRAEAKAYAAAPVSGDVLLDGTSDTIAGANLQAFLQNLASQAGVSFDDIEALPARQTGALRRIGVSVDMAVPWPEFTAFIAAIEAAPLRMTVDDLSLAAQSQPPAKDAVVKASFSLFAFRAGNAP